MHCWRLVTCNGLGKANRWPAWLIVPSRDVTVRLSLALRDCIYPKRERRTACLHAVRQEAYGWQKRPRAMRGGFSELGDDCQAYRRTRPRLGAPPDSSRARSPALVNRQMAALGIACCERDVWPGGTMRSLVIQHQPCPVMVLLCIKWPTTLPSFTPHCTKFSSRCLRQIRKDRFHVADQTTAGSGSTSAGFSGRSPCYAGVVCLLVMFVLAHVWVAVLASSASILSIDRATRFVVCS